MATCPTCGQPFPKPPEGALNADALWGVLKYGVPHRELYRGQDGNWYVTYGGGKVAAAAVSELIEQEQIQRVYSSCADAYHIGPTLDCEATMAFRRGKKRKDWKPIYIGQAA